MCLVLGVHFGHSSSLRLKSVDSDCCVCCNLLQKSSCPFVCAFLFAACGNKKIVQNDHAKQLVSTNITMDEFSYGVRTV